MDFLIPPYGGALCRQLAEPSSVERLKEEARATRAVVLSPRWLLDLDLLLNGLIPEFTGISDPYEVPEHPEIQLDTTDLSPVEAAQKIFLFLLRERYLDGAI